MELKDTSAIVTGAGSGLGLATARRLLAEGCKVAALDRNVSVLRGGEEEYSAIIEADVTSEQGLAEAFAQAVDTCGEIRMVVHCAGVLGNGAVLSPSRGTLPLKRFADVIAINLTGTFNSIRLAAEHMQGLSPLEDGERGVIITTASIAAWEGLSGQAAYAASKGGVAAMTLPLARELAIHGIRVMSIAPGMFQTGLLSNIPDQTLQHLIDDVPFPKRAGKGEEFAELAIAIARNRMLNGETIRLDGALRMRNPNS
ncbi:SDR family NAD(P)-dependent oxidoreductase [Cryobacterium sp. TMT2-23]|uniref:SDR family NAD(P)-dependent oxidoreductase n=1 Tax=Cryobacterium sp. TMT2-23 TaxID=1259252 RepID=UPI00106902D5|nr:SDR family NAD(P)-dependent oxidoreductase [Cryobacterium sp. TMT2-23]TFD29110.1 SDR family NAD(P)-dependent oxidoreductase [Cryobacterium sp. TMT2-23]